MRSRSSHPNSSKRATPKREHGLPMAVVIAALMANSSMAQSLPKPPDPGAINKSLREQTEGDRNADRNIDVFESAGGIGSTDGASNRLTADALGATLTVNGFRVQGATLIPPDEIQAALAPLSGKALTFPDLIRQVQAVTQLYTRRGLIAQTVIPEQDVVDGLVQLRVLEGRLGALRIDRTPGALIPDEQVRAVVESSQKAGEPIQVQRLERSMLLLNDLSGITARAVLQPGTQPETTDLVVRLGAGPAIAASVDYDNGGTRSVGEQRATANVKFNNVDGRGGRLALIGTAMFVDHRVNSYANLAYQTPLSSDGWLLQAGGSYLAYRLGEQFAALSVRGRSSTIYGGLQYALSRASAGNMYLIARAEHRRAFASATDQCIPITDKQVNALLVGVAGDRISGFADAQQTYQFTATHGDVIFGPGARFGLVDACGVQEVQVDPSGTAGRYTKLNANFSHQQQIGERWSFAMSAQAQLAFDNLDGSEQMTLGGPYAVRAYPVGEAGGDSGALVNLELRYRLQERVVLTGFADVGRVRRIQRPEELGASAALQGRNEVDLAGAGLALTYAQPSRFSLSASMAWRVGRNPLRNALGLDSDSRKRSPRVWLAATVYF